MSKEGIIKLLELWVKGQEKEIANHIKYDAFGDAQYCMGKRDAYVNILETIKEGEK